MRQVGINAYEQNFQFIIDGKVYACPGFVAEFLSPAVSRCRQIDSPIEIFRIKLPGTGNTFRKILNLGQGLETEIEKACLASLVPILREFENSEFLETFIQDHFTGDLTDDNVCERLKLKSEISYLTSSFGQLGETVIRQLSVSELSQILYHPLLQLQSEDSLYDFIASSLDEDADFSSLFRYIRFDFLSNERFWRFISWAKEHFDVVDASIWFGICCRISLCSLMRVQSSSIRHSEPPLNHSTQQPNSDSPVECFPFLHGIIGSLKLEHGSSWTDFLKGSLSGIHAPISPYIYNHEFATDISLSNGFASTDVESSWLEYHFLHAKVYPTHFAVRSWFPGCSTDQWPKKWVLQGWNDSDELVELDADTDQERNLMLDNLVVTFPVRHPHFVRRIRFTQIGPSARNWHCLIISCLAIFGEIVQDE
jgi:hypothetical protein